MSAEKKPEVIELERYRKAAHARAAQQAAKASRKAPERILGSRRHAGWLLLLVILVVTALTIVPRLLPF